jgi:hypothetical protein
MLGPVNRKQFQSQIGDHDFTGATDASAAAVGPLPSFRIESDPAQQNSGELINDFTSLAFIDDLAPGRSDLFRQTLEPADLLFVKGEF